jgi:glucose 1-dehydrogenase
MRLVGKAALITGGSSGIGRAIALAYGREGADVVVHYNRGREQADAIVRDLQALGRRAVALQADVAEVAATQALVAATVAALGKLDVLVCSAGVEVQESFLDVTEAHYDLVLAVNLKGAFFTAQAAARQMVQQGTGGRIVNISSIHEDVAFLRYAPYCLAKGGMRMMARTLAQELAPHGITINNVAPGAIATPINKKTLENSTLLGELHAVIPLQRLGTPEEVAAVAVFLGSDDAAYVTGSTYYVDGGMTHFNKGL